MLRFHFGKEVLEIVLGKAARKALFAEDVLNGLGLPLLELPDFSSTVPGAMSRYAFTVRVCPMRWERSIAWASTAGFHQGHRAPRSSRS